MRLASETAWHVSSFRDNDPQRDAELLRQANEHFAFIAHELRDPLSSATMAFLLPKSKGQLPAGESRPLG
jgi:hypothetical protein